MRNIDHVELKALYLDQREKVTDIAKHLGCSTTTIYKRLRKLGLSRKQLLLVEDITGQRFERLVALRYIRNDKFGKAIWLVRCDCGKEKEINASGMKAGLVKSCGCYKREKLSTGHKDISGAYWNKLRKAAAQRDYAFTVSLEEAWEIFQVQEGKCALSAVPIVLVTNNDRYYDQTASLDRIDSTLGYTKENVQWVHKRVNFLKRDYTEQELVFWCSKIAELKKETFVELDPKTLIEKRPLNKNIQSFVNAVPVESAK